MTLPRAVGANDADKPCIIIKLELNVIEMSPLINSNAPYSHKKLLKREVCAGKTSASISVH